MVAIIGKKLRESAIINQRVLVDLIRKQGPLSQRQLSDITGLHRSTLSKNISSLMDAGLIYEAGVSPKKTGGKLQRLLKVVPGGPLVLGVGLIRNEVNCVLMDLSGSIPHMENFTFEGDLADLPKELKTRVISKHHGIIAAGIGLPGMIDTKNGRVIASYHWEVNDLNLANLMEKELRIPCFIDNDVRVAANLEFNPQAASSIYIAFNHLKEDGNFRIRGFGSAMAIGGQLYYGANCCAGENMVMAENSLEKPLLLYPETRHLLSHQEAELDDAAKEFADGFVNVIRQTTAIFDPEEIILGGSIPIANSHFYEYVTEQAIKKDILGYTTRQVIVKAPEHPITNVAEGAAELAFANLDTEVIIQHYKAD